MKGERANEPPMSSPDIWFCGDPHGDFRQVLRLAADRRPDAVIFLGDLELPAPLEEVMDPMLQAGIVVRGIHGNHDVDTPELWHRIAEGPLCTSFNLDGRVEQICGLRIAGLGGIFHGKAWHPPNPPEFETYADLNASLTPWWWNEEQRKQQVNHITQKRLLHRATIFPDVYQRLAELETDLLITHEAPGGDDGHEHGFQAIRDLAELLGAKAAWHGHHHESRKYRLDSSCKWTAVGYREIVDLDGNRIE
jgi:Icc-related predicted phosphoesterase